MLHASLLHSLPLFQQRLLPSLPPLLPWSQPCRALCFFFRIQTGVTQYSTVGTAACPASICRHPPRPPSHPPTPLQGLTRILLKGSLVSALLTSLLSTHTRWSRDCRKDTVDKKGMQHLGELALANCRDLAAIIQVCRHKKIPKRCHRCTAAAPQQHQMRVVPRCSTQLGPPGMAQRGSTGPGWLAPPCFFPSQLPPAPPPGPQWNHEHRIRLFRCVPGWCLVGPPRGGGHQHGTCRAVPCCACSQVPSCPGRARLAQHHAPFLPF